jgi:ferritin-like metal-binding protein YciE
MGASTNEVVCRYLQDAIAAESSFESQLRAFSEEGDDDEVRSVFSQHAEETRLQYHRLAARLEQLGGTPSPAKSMLAHLFSLSPKLVQATHAQEERIAQNLIMAYTVETSECAMYEALAAVAQAAGDPATHALAREIQAEERQTAGKLWRLLPSRAKIAFNMLTAGEVDPVLETKAPANRVI